MFFETAYCYPRTLYEQFIELKEFPRYYKTNNPDTLIVRFEQHRFSPDSGREEYLVVRKDSSTGRILPPRWEPKDLLVQDAVGPVYAERGGLFGILYDTYGKSTYDRLRVKTSYEHSVTRLSLFEQKSSRLPVGGISYSKGYPMAVPGEADEAETSSISLIEDEEEEDAEEETKSKMKRGRSKTPSKKKKAHAE